MKKKLKPYKTYLVRFHDHCIGDEDEGLICSIVGQFIKETKNCYIFSHWIVESEDRELVESNLEKTSILKAVILQIKQVQT